MNTLSKTVVWVILIGFLLLVNSYNTSKSSGEEASQSTSSTVDIDGLVTPAPSFLPNYGNPTFHGNDCTEDCSGHEAGYEWAEEKDIDNVDDCGGNSESFIEGCRSYVEENYPDDTDEPSDYEESEDSYDY